jgi:hypothetical protein
MLTGLQWVHMKLLQVLQRSAGWARRMSSSRGKAGVIPYRGTWLVHTQIQEKIRSARRLDGWRFGLGAQRIS